MKKQQMVTTIAMIVVIFFAGIVLPAPALAQEAPVSVAQFAASEELPPLPPSAGEAPEGKNCVILIHGNPQIMECGQAKTESARIRASRAAEAQADQNVARIAEAWKSAPAGTTWISVNPDGTMYFTSNAIFLPSVVAPPPPIGTPIPVAVGTSHPVPEDQRTVTYWYDSSSSVQGWMFVVGLGLLADDGTVIGLIDDPVAITLIATASGWYVLEAVRQNYNNTYPSYGFGGYSSYSADMHTVYNGGALTGSSSSTINVEGMAVVTSVFNGQLELDGAKWIKELSIIAIRPATEIVFDVVQSDGVHVYAQSPNYMDGAVRMASIFAAHDYVVQRAINTPLAVSGIASNWWFGVRHQESDGIRAAVMSFHQNWVQSQGDGHSNGSIQIWAGVDASTLQATVGGVYIASSMVNYIAFSMPVQVGWGSGLIRLGDTQYYYNRANVIWRCAWPMSNSIGHHKIPERELLTVGSGLEKWEATKVKYNLTIPLSVLYLPL